MRWFIQLLLGICGLFILVTALVILLLDADDLKPSLYALVRQHTGLVLDIQGPLELSLFPHPQLEAGEVRLTLPGSSPGQSLLETTHCVLGISPRSMWSGRLQFSRINLHGLVLDADQAFGLLRTSPLQSRPFSAVPHGAPLAINHLQELQVTNATLSHVPGLNDSELTISLVDVQGLGKEGPASMRCQATCKNVSLDMTGSLTMPRSGLSLLMEDVQARVTLPNPLQATPPITTEVTGTFFLDPRNHRMVVRAMRATMPGLDMLTSSTLNWTRSSWEGGIIVNANTPQCIPALGLPAPLVSSLPRDLDLRTHFSLHPDTLVLRDVHAVMDGQSFHGQTKISDFSRPNITFKIFGDHVDLSRYLFSAPNSPSTPPQWLKTARIRGSFSANRMTWGSMVAENPQTLVRARKGILRIYPFKATMDKGSVDANIRVNLNVSPPTSTLRAQMKNMKINNMTDTGQPSTGLIGSMDIFLDLAWDDLPWRPRCATLRGQATLDAVNGTLVGVRLPLQHSSALLTQRTSFPKNVIPFSRLNVRFAMHEGIMKTRRLSLTSPSLTLNARGTYDLCKDRLDGLLFVDSPQSQQTLHVQGSRNNPRLRKVPQNPE